MTPLVAELVGTAVLLLLGNGVVANVVLKGTKGNGSGWMVISTAWAVAVYVGVVIAGPYSGAHLNPAVTIGLALAGKFAWADVLGYCIAQFVGAFIGMFFVWLMYKDHFNLTVSEDDKRACFCTIPQVRNPFTNFISELLGCFVLVFGVLFIVAPSKVVVGGEEIVGLGSLGALPVSLIILAIGLSLGGTTGYAINPARDFSPRLLHSLLSMGNKNVKSDWGYAWVPFFGPILGAVCAAGLYYLVTNYQFV